MFYLSVTTVSCFFFCFTFVLFGIFLTGIVPSVRSISYLSVTVFHKGFVCSTLSFSRKFLFFLSFLVALELLGYITAFGGCIWIPVTVICRFFISICRTFMQFVFFCLLFLAIIDFLYKRFIIPFVWERYNLVQTVKYFKFCESAIWCYFQNFGDFNVNCVVPFHVDLRQVRKCW